MRDEPSRRIDTPEPGYFRMRLVRKGPWVGARIYRSALFGDLRATINGHDVDVFDVWTSGERISEDDYNWLIAHPPADPYQQQHISTRGISDAMREESERLFLLRRPLA